MLYRLLAERGPDANISHKRMPTMQQHRGFVRLRPYDAWYLIKASSEYIGAIYLTDLNEVGISLFREHQGKGYGGRAVRALMKKHQRQRYLANMSPVNRHSISMFIDLGFRWLQVTYAYEPN